MVLAIGTAACDGKANAASPSSSAAGKRYDTPPQAHAESETSSPLYSTSPSSNTATYPTVAEITSLDGDPYCRLPYCRLPYCRLPY
jgi:hypothetical protein